MSTSWNPSDKAAAITLSGSDQIATGGAGGNAGVRSVHSFTTEKIYCEFQIGSLSSFVVAPGVAAGTWNTASGSAAFGIPTDGVGKYATASYIDYNGTQYDNPNVPTFFNSGNRCAIAFDGANARVAFNIYTGGSWSGWRGTGGTADPTTGANMVDVSATLGSAVVKYLALVMGNGDNCTLRSATAEWTGTCPSGYGEINPSVIADESINNEDDYEAASVPRWLQARQAREFTSYFELDLHANNTQNVLGATTVKPSPRDDSALDTAWIQWLGTVSPLAVAIYQTEWGSAPLSDDVSSTASISGAQTLDNITQSAAAAGIASISGAQTLDAITQSANAGAPGIFISGAQTLDNITQSAAAAGIASISGAQTLASFTTTATLKGIGSISGAQTLANITQSAPTKGIASLSGSQTLPTFTLSATVSVDNSRSISASQSLDPIVLGANVGLLGKISGAQAFPTILLDAFVSPPRSMSGAQAIGGISLDVSMRSQFWTDEDASASVWSDSAASSGVWTDEDLSSGSWS